MKTSVTYLVQVSLLTSLLMQMACAYGPSTRPKYERWADLVTLVDGAIEIRVSIPVSSTQTETWEGKTIFVGSEANEFSELFVLGYDRGYGSLSEADLTRFHGSIYRIDGRNDDSSLSFEDFFLLIHSERPEVKIDRLLLGPKVINGTEWYRVKYVGKQPYTGSIFYHLMENDYALMISMIMFEESANETKLYKQRYSDLLKVLTSVKITVADFTNKGSDARK